MQASASQPEPAEAPGFIARNKDALIIATGMFSALVAIMTIQTILFNARMTSFEESMDARMTSFENSMDARMTSFENSMDARMTSFEESMDARMTSFEESMGARMTSFEESMGARMTSFEESMGARMTSFEESMGARMTSFEQGMGGRMASFENSMGARMTSFESSLRETVDANRETMFSLRAEDNVQVREALLQRDAEIEEVRERFFRVRDQLLEGGFVSVGAAGDTPP